MSSNTDETPQHENTANLEFGSAADAARLLNVSKNFLDRMRMDGRGPPFLKFGRMIRYEIAALRAWAKAQERLSTAQRDGMGVTEALAIAAEKAAVKRAKIGAYHAKRRGRAKRAAKRAVRRAPKQAAE
jgi:hypothetical protein